MQITIKSTGFDNVMQTLKTVSGSYGFHRALRTAMDSGGEYLQRQLESTTRTWSKRPKFERSFQQIAGGDWAMAIMTDNDIWNWIDRGTKPYRIYPRPGNRVGLIFRTGGRPKTIAGVFGSTLGSAPTSGIIRAKVVRHPGIKARRWSELGVRYYGVTATKLIVESLTNYLNQIWR